MSVEQQENKRIPITVFTGAGASRADPITLPTMKEFFEQIMDEKRYPTHPRISNKNYFKFVFDTLYGEEDNYDLEHVMGALYEMDSFMNTPSWELFMHPQLFDNLTSKVSQHTTMRTNNNSITLKNAIKESCESTFNQRKSDAKELVRNLEDLIREKYEPIKYDSIKKVYEPFFELLIDPKKIFTKSYLLPFFTTNYDMSIDWFFRTQEYENRKIQSEWIEKTKSNWLTDS